MEPNEQQALDQAVKSLEGAKAALEKSLNRTSSRTHHLPVGLSLAALMTA